MFHCIPYSFLGPSSVPMPGSRERPGTCWCVGVCGGGEGGGQRVKPREPSTSSLTLKQGRLPAGVRVGLRTEITDAFLC